MRELPTGVADALEQAGGHALEQIAEAELDADGFHFFEVFREAEANGGPS